MKTPLAPPDVEARAARAGRLGWGVGPRGFFLLAIGLLWLGPALFDARFAVAMIAWDALIAMAWGADAFRLPAPGALTVRRRWLAPASLAVASDVELTVENASDRPMHLRIVDAVPHPLRSEPPDAPLSVGGRREATAAYRIKPGARGAVAVGDAYLRCQSPLRIAERWARAPLAQTVVVYPDLEEGAREAMLLVRGRQRDMERRSVRIRGAGRSFQSLREYREGDEFRDICWSATARRAKLVTRLYEVERSQAIWIVIDTGRLMRARVASLTKLDHAVNGALALAQVALGSGDRVGLLAYGRDVRQRLPAARGSAHLRAILQDLAVVGPDESEADHLRAAGRLLNDQKQRALVVWITDLPDTAMTPDVVQAASRLMKRHLVLFAVIGEPDLSRVALRRPATPTDMYEAAAAQEVMHRRELLLARLRTQGALAFDVAGTLSARIVNTYLDVKQRGRL